ncbi:hypothetical protein ACWGK1_35830 [Streptomyces wedmorensis]
MVDAGGGGDDLFAQLMVAGAQGGELGGEAALEDGMGGGAAVDGEQPFGLGAVGVVEEVVGESGVGVQGAADVAFGEAVGLECSPGQWSGGWGVEGGEPGGDLIAAVWGLVGQCGESLP